MIRVPYIDLAAQHLPIKDELLKAAEEVITSGQFILGKYTESFENSFAELCHSKFAIGVANGTDALILSMKALGVGYGDEVITAPNSYLASASSIALAGARIVFADVTENYNINPSEIKKVITPKTKAIIAVHLTGRPAEMDEIMKIAKEKNIFVIEDAAQAVGAEYKGKKVGSIGDLGCFSLHPLKNLSAAGDGGMITTNNESLYQSILKLRNHGLKSRDECESWSLNSRLDALQAALLSVKLKYLPVWEKRRRQIAEIYQTRLGKFVNIPIEKDYEKSVYHTFIITCKNRNSLQQFLSENGIDTKVHYPIPIHLQEAAKSLGYKKGDFPITENQVECILSLPVYPELSDEQVNYVCEKIIEYYTK